MFRREWRQQILVLSLLIVAVAAAVGFSSAAYNMAPIPGNAEFGTASHLLRFEELDPMAFSANIAVAEEWFGTIDVIGRRDVSVAGRFEPIEFRSQDPKGAYGALMLALLDGRFPTAAGDVGVTNEVAEGFGLDLGARFAIDGTDRTVVGIVENPSDLNDEFALVSPTDGAALESATILVEAGDERVLAFRPPGGGGREISSRGTNEGVIAAVGVLGVATVALLLIALLAAAGFVVIAQRRLRQLGMFSAIGATEKHLRLAMVANGAVIGVVAAVAGASIGILAWIAVVPRLETALGFRIDRFNVPWWLLVAGMLLAVVTATGAAWWPARAVARTPIVLALSGRPPRPRPAHRSAAVAGLLVAAGVVSLALAGNVADDYSVDWGTMLLVALGTVATVVGVLLAGPLAIRALAGLAARLPVAPRLAVRDLARYQARSAAALAAISLALGIPVAVIIAVSAAQHGAESGNLSDRQLVIRAAEIDGPFVPEVAEVTGLQAQVDAIAATMDDPTITALDVALDPLLVPQPGTNGRPGISLARREGDGWADLSLLYVATPALLEHHGIDLDVVRSDTEVLTGESGELVILGVAEPNGSQQRAPVVPKIERISPNYSSLPGSFIMSDVLSRRGWEAVPSGRWLVVASAPPTVDQLARAREIAARAGLTIESRDHQDGLTRLRSWATAVGVFLALGILAMTVGLIRSEAAPDLRTLTATGATSTTRRALTAATAGALAALGVTLGTIGAVAASAAGYLSDVVGTLGRVPVLHIVVLAIGTPIAAAFAGWLLGGREPPSLTRQPIE